MADTDTEVEVPEEGVVEVDLGDAATPPKKAAEPEPKPEPKPEPRVRIKEPPEADEAAKTLQAAVDNERRLRTAAEQTALTAQQVAERERQARLSREQELQATRETLEARELAAIETGIVNATKEIAAAQKEVSAALAAGEFEKVAEAQTKLGKATAALDRFEGKKADYEAGQQTRTTEGAVTETQPMVTATPLERWIAGMEPAAQTWLRAHQECAPPHVGGRLDMHSKMMRGHYDALAQGFGPNTEDYFRVIEESTGFRKPAAAAATEEGSAEVKPKPEPAPRKAQVSAPPSREPPGTPSNGTSRTVRLSKDEQEAARISFPNLDPAKAYAEYAKNKVALDAEGKLGRTTH